MRKTTKFFISIICVAVAAVCIFAGINATRQGGEDETTTTAAPVTVTPVTEPSTEETTTESPEKKLAEMLIGKWSDSAGMSGFEFFENGKASFTYANLDALGVNFDGTVDNGTYKLEGNTLTITYSIYTATIEKTYEIEIEDDVLKMKDKEDGETSSYVRSDTDINTQPTSSNASVSDELYGSWENKTMGKIYKFAGNGKVTVTLDGEVYDGVYVTEGTDITIQFAAYGKKITEKYSFSVTTNALTLKNQAGSEFIFLRAGTNASAASDDDLLGLWRDSANMSGYEFKENGVVEITFVNIEIPVVNVPVNGTFTGAYDIEDGVLTLTYYIYGKAITNSYTYKIESNSLKLKDTEDGKISTYMKQ